jgi:hypothetical protein
VALRLPLRRNARPPDVPLPREGAARGGLPVVSGRSGVVRVRVRGCLMHSRRPRCPTGSPRVPTERSTVARERHRDAGALHRAGGTSYAAVEPAAQQRRLAESPGSSPYISPPPPFYLSLTPPPFIFNLPSPPPPPFHKPSPLPPLFLYPLNLTPPNPHLTTPYP